MLLDRPSLELEASRNGLWGLAYWLGIGLAEAIQSQRPGLGLPPAVANLQAHGLERVLIDGKATVPERVQGPTPIHPRGR